MHPPKTATPATADTVNGRQISDRLAGATVDTDSPRRCAAQALFRGVAIASPTTAPITDKPILPHLAEAHQRDRLAREQIAQGKDSGEPEVQIDYAGAIRRHGFA
jgi:hypothetical protein